MERLGQLAGAQSVTGFTLRGFLCDARHTIIAKRLLIPGCGIIISYPIYIEANYEKHRFMLCCRYVHQHVGSTYERCGAEKGVEVTIKAVPVAEFKDNIAAADIVLLGPQVKYELAKLQAQAEPLGKKVAVIDMMDYGMMKGDVVLEKALKLLE